MIRPKDHASAQAEGLPLTAASYAALLDRLPEACVVTDATARHYLLANAAALQLLGYDPAVLRHLAPADVTDEQDRPRIPGVVRDLRQHGSWSGTWHFLRGDGTPLAATVHAAAVSVDGQYVHEALLHAASDYPPVSTSSDLVALVSHELRSPLATLIGFTELLMTRDVSDTERLEYLALMHREGQRLSRLVHDLLDVERWESGLVQLRPAPVDLAALLRFAADLAGRDPEHPVCLRIDGPLPSVAADPDRLQQVLANLLDNARKYSPRGGPIRIQARKAAEGVEVAVEDEGLGLPAEALERVFDKFYRVQQSEHRQISGSGLGLAVVRRIMEAHGGRVWAESEGPGAGTRMVFRLPAEPIAA